VPGAVVASPIRPVDVDGRESVVGAKDKLGFDAAARLSLLRAGGLSLPELVGSGATK
jgi:hypothetical protein